MVMRRCHDSLSAAAKRHVALDASNVQLLTQNSMAYMYDATKFSKKNATDVSRPFMTHTAYHGKPAELVGRTNFVCFRLLTPKCHVGRLLVEFGRNLFDYAKVCHFVF